MRGCRRRRCSSRGSSAAADAGPGLVLDANDAVVVPVSTTVRPVSVDALESPSCRPSPVPEQSGLPSPWLPSAFWACVSASPSAVARELQVDDVAEGRDDVFRLGHSDACRRAGSEIPARLDDLLRAQRRIAHHLQRELHRLAFGGRKRAGRLALGGSRRRRGGSDARWSSRCAPGEVSPVSRSTTSRTSLSVGAVDSALVAADSRRRSGERSPRAPRRPARRGDRS